MPDQLPPLRHYVGVFRRQWWLVVLTTLLGIGAAILVTSFQTSIYQASSKIVVGQSGSLFQANFGGSIQPFTQTMTNLLQSDVVAATVIENLGLDATPEEVLENLGVSTKAESSVLDVTYDSSNPQEAVNVLAEVGSVFTDLVEQQLGEPVVQAQQPEDTTDSGTTRDTVPPITATVFDPAHLLPGTISPRPVRNAAIAAVLGLVLGLILAFVRDALDDRIRSRRDAESWLRAPVVGALPRGMRGKGAIGLGGRNAPKPEFLEAVQRLRANLQFSSAGLAGPITVVTSALPEEGKSTVAANVATSLALSGRDVILVEADLRRPRLQRYVGTVQDSAGLVEVIDGHIELEAALEQVPLADYYSAGARAPGARSRHTRRGRSSRSQVVAEAATLMARGRLRVLSAGALPPNPSTVLTASNVDHLIEALRTEAEYIIVDTPPLLLVGDAYPLVRASDSVIVVAREGRTTKEIARSLRETLDALGAQTVSVVLTDSTDQPGYGYGYGSQRIDRIADA